MQNIEEIYKQYFEVVNKYLFCLTQNADIAEELTQETFYRAVKKIDKFKGDCKISTWLCQIAKNLWYDETNKNKRLKTKNHNIKGKHNLPIGLIYQHKINFNMKFR